MVFILGTSPRCIYPAVLSFFRCPSKRYLLYPVGGHTEYFPFLCSFKRMSEIFFNTSKFNYFIFSVVFLNFAWLSRYSMIFSGILFFYPLSIAKIEKKRMKA